MTIGSSGLLVDCILKWVGSLVSTLADDDLLLAEFFLELSTCGAR